MVRACARKVCPRRLRWLSDEELVAFEMCPKCQKLFPVAVPLTKAPYKTGKVKWVLPVALLILLIAVAPFVSFDKGPSTEQVQGPIQLAGDYYCYTCQHEACKGQRIRIHTTDLINDQDRVQIAWELSNQGRKGEDLSGIAERDGEQVLLRLQSTLLDNTSSQQIFEYKQTAYQANLEHQSLSNCIFKRRIPRETNEQ